MLLAAQLSSYECTWKVWRALEKLELLSAIASSNSYTLTLVLSKLLACIPYSVRRTLSINQFLNTSQDN